MREMRARLSTALVLSSRIGVRSLRSDRSSSTTSRPSSKKMMAGNGVCLQRIDIRPELELSYSVLLGCISAGMKIRIWAQFICVKLEDPMFDACSFPNVLDLFILIRNEVSGLPSDHLRPSTIIM